MRTNKLLILLLLSLGFVSCQPEGRIFSENQDLSPNLEWLKKDVLEFKVPIEDLSSTYDLSLTFRYVTGYQFNVAKVKITETSPSGKELTFKYDLKIRDANGDYIGSPGLDIWDSEHLVESKRKFHEKGTYTYKIEHNMPSDPMHFAMELGMIYNKSK